jgi:hypothetical protein
LIEADLSSVHAITHTGAPIQEEYREAVRKAMLELLSSKPEIAEALVPDFPLACKRMTPGPGYLESLVLDNVSAAGLTLFVDLTQQCHLVTDAIDSFTEKGLKLKSGEEIELDAIICATGSTRRPSPPSPSMARTVSTFKTCGRTRLAPTLASLYRRCPTSSPSSALRLLWVPALFCQ